MLKRKYISTKMINSVPPVLKTESKVYLGNKITPGSPAIPKHTVKPKREGCGCS